MSRRGRESTYIAPIVEETRRIQQKEYDGEEITKEEVERFHKLKDQREDEVFDAIPKLQCCEVARSYHPVRFSVDVYDNDKPPTEGYWHIAEDKSLGEMRRAKDPEWFKRPQVYPPAKFCPFCAMPVPKMRLKKDPPKDLCRVTDGGYYCDTCAERLSACVCLPPEAAFEPDV